MLLRIFRANHFYNFVLIPILGIALILKSYLSSKSISFNESDFLMPLALPFIKLKLPVTILIILNYFTTLFLCFQLLQTNAKFAFVRERTFLPATIFMLIVLAFPALHIIQPAAISAIFVLIAIRNVFNAFNKEMAVSNAFNAAFFIGIASLFYIYSAIFILVIPSSIKAMRKKISFREVLSSLIGFLLPWGFLFTAFFFFKSIDELLELLNNTVSLNRNALYNHLPSQIFFGVIQLFTLLSSLFILSKYDTKKISTRRYFKVLAFFFWIGIILFALPPVSVEALYIVAIPLTFLISNYLVFMRRRFWAEVLFFILIISAIALQFAAQS